MITTINVILVRPTFSGNIGASARALANMGGDRLVLIDPQCEIDEAAKQWVAGAQPWLEKVTNYRSWKEFYAAEGDGYRVALTRRQGKRRQIKTLPRTLEDLKTQAPTDSGGRPLYLIFGPEAHGLSADDMAWANRAAYLPIPGEFKSMNLAQAVMLGLYLAQEHASPFREREKSEVQKPKYFPDDSIKQWLIAMGFSLHRHKASAYLTLRRLLLQNWPNERELHVLEAILQQNIRKLEELKALQKPTPGQSALLLEEVPDQLS